VLKFVAEIRIWYLIPIHVWMCLDVVTTEIRNRSLSGRAPGPCNPAAPARRSVVSASARAASVCFPGVPCTEIALPPTTAEHHGTGRLGERRPPPQAIPTAASPTAAASPATAASLATAASPAAAATHLAAPPRVWGTVGRALSAVKEGRAQ
jgi:hypothetical protein